MNPSETAARTALYAADDAWSAELRKAFGSNAGNARYTRQGMGEPHTALRRAYYAHMAASMEWHAIVGWNLPVNSGQEKN